MIKIDDNSTEKYCRNEYDMISPKLSQPKSIKWMPVADLKKTHWTQMYNVPNVIKEDKKNNTKVKN